MANAIEGGLQKINGEELFQIHHSWKDVNDKREIEMLQNIYTYSRESNHNKAVFTIGAGHKKSIVKKIKENETREDLKLNWTLDPW